MYWSIRIQSAHTLSPSAVAAADWLAANMGKARAGKTKVGARYKGKLVHPNSRKAKRLHFAAVRRDRMDLQKRAANDARFVLGTKIKWFREVLDGDVAAAVSEEGTEEGKDEAEEAGEGLHRNGGSSSRKRRTYTPEEICQLIEEYIERNTEEREAIKTGRARASGQRLNLLEMQYKQEMEIYEGGKGFGR